MGAPFLKSDSTSHKYISRMVNVFDLPERVASRIVIQIPEIHTVSGMCWKWTGRLHGGYGRVRLGKFSKSEKAHKAIYEYFFGTVAVGLELDHLCQNTACVNPEHLEPVTRAENLRRSHTTGKGNGTRTHCRHGHPFTNKNTYAWGGKRYCRICQGVRQLKHNNRKRSMRLL